jgi:hypothetical protein
MGSDKHLSKLDKVTVLLIVHLDDTPRVLTTADLAPVGRLDLLSGTNNSEGDLGHDLVVLSDGLLVIKLISRALENLDAMVLNVRQDL